MISFKQFLNEYLTDEQRDRYAGVKMTTKARSDTDHFFGAGNDLIKEPIKGFGEDKSEVHKAIERHIGQEFTPEEYRSGMIQREGKKVLIPQLLKDNKQLKHQFDQDNTRTGKGRGATHYVTVVRGTEVAGQTNSTPDANHPRGHSWGDASCKNVDNGSNRHYLAGEIKQGTVVVRVHDPAGQEIYRATLHPHQNDQKHVAYAVDSEYGLKHPLFKAHAQDVAQRLSGEHKGGSILYRKKSGVYNDSGETNLVHPSATSDQLDGLLKDSRVAVRTAAVNHPSITTDQLDIALGDEESAVRKKAAMSSKATSEQISRAQDDKSDTVRLGAVLNPNATKDHLDKALQDKNYMVKRAVIAHPNVTKEHLDQAQMSSEWQVRSAVARSPNATQIHLQRALNDPSGLVRSSVSVNPNVTQEHLDKIIRDEDPNVRMSVLYSPKATPEHLDQALDDENHLVRLEAISNLNASKDHLIKASKDSHPFVREKALERLKEFN